MSTCVYDDANQLTSLTYTLNQTTLGDLTYTCDAAGNRTAVGGTWARTGLPVALTSATYDAANRVTTWAGTAFTYDANGNLTSDGLTSYTWDARDQLIALSGDASASFAYYSTGRRRSKTVSGTTTNFLYDGWNFLQEQASGGTPTANLLTGLGFDETFTRTDGIGTGSFLVDALGSALALADASGSVQTTYTYQPFGAATVAGTSSTNTQQFSSRENDGTGLYDYRARYYSPGLQRFVSEDPLDFHGGSTDLYTYVRNSPTNLADPLGLWVRNLDPVRPVPVKPEDGPWGKLPPCSQYPGSPDGWLPPGASEGPPWYKVPGKSWLPDNNVEIGPGDKFVCVSGPCRWPWPFPGMRVLPKAPDSTWIPPRELPELPGIRPIPGCKPKNSKSDQ